MIDWIKKLSDGKHYIVTAPMGSLMALQYGLSSARASQPRNFILGQSVSGVIGLPVS